MAPVKRPRVESDVGADAAAPASKRPRGRAVSSRVDTGLRAGAAADRQPPRQRPPLKRPPMAPRQPGQERPAAGTGTGAVTLSKVDSQIRPAAVSAEQREAWRAARRQKLAERILRGRSGAAAACLGMDAERQRSAAPSRPRAVASRLLQPRPAAASAGTAAAAPAATGGAASAAAAARRASSAGPAVRSARGQSSAPRAASQGPPQAVGGIRLNRAAERRLAMMQDRRRQQAEQAERRSTLAAPVASCGPAVRRPAPVPAVPRRQTVAGSRPAPPPARRPAPTGSCRPPAAPTRRSPRSAPGTAPRVTAVKTGLSRQRLAALARPKQPPRQRPSPAGSARVVKPVQRRPAVVPTVGGFLAPPADRPPTLRRSLSTMHRARSASDRDTAVHRPAARVRAASVAAPLQEETDSITTGPSVQITDTETTTESSQQQPTTTPGRSRQSVATPALVRQSVATPGRFRQSAATPGRPRQSVATPSGARQSVSRPRLPSELTLQERLEQWLARRGKQLSSFRHLHCFGRELSQPTPARAGAAKARRSAAPRVQRDPGSPPLRITPPRRASKSPGTPDTVTMATPETVSTATPETVAMATPAAPPTEMPPPTPADTESGQERVDNVLSDLSELQDLGLPSDQVVCWLERLSQDPVSASRARYWLCRATAAEREGQMDTVLNCFRQASRAQAEPIAELISGLEQFVQRASGASPAPGTPLEASEDAENAPPTPGSGRRRRTGTRTPRRPLLDRSNVFDSSVIKYALIDDGTVLKKLAALRLGAGEDPENRNILSVITPVRRSTRRKSLKPPVNPHLALFDSVEAISESLRRSALFRKNSALMSP